MILVIPSTDYVRIILCTQCELKQIKKVPKALQKKITKIRIAGDCFPGGFVAHKSKQVECTPNTLLYFVENSTLNNIAFLLRKMSETSQIKRLKQIQQMKTE